MSFEFATAQRILFGDGILQQTGALAAAMGKRALVVTGATPSRVQPLFDLLAGHEIDHTTFSVKDEPTVNDALAGVQAAQAAASELVIAIGGGSVIDAGKAIAALLANPGDPYEHLEVIGRGRPLVNPPAPLVAIPTTAGTGSEVTRNAVLASPEHQVKVSLRSLLMLPRVALVDPTLTHSAPPAITAATGLDALTQLIEPFVSCRANLLTDALCRAGLPLAIRSLRRVYHHGDDVQARSDMAFASLCGGLALANAGLGIVHGIAGPFGGMYHAPHGAICAAVLPHAARVNIRALRDRASGHPALARYREVAVMCSEDADAEPEIVASWLDTLCRELAIPPLGSYGFGEVEFPLLLPKVQAASSTKGNPLALTDAEVREILLSAQ
jgi:alcohol dehydrogenase class IV